MAWLDSTRVRVALVLAALLATSLALRGTYGAVFYSAITSHVGNATAPSAAIYDPTGVTAAPRGDTMRVSFTDPGVGHHGDGYALYAYHFGNASGSCSTTQSFYTFVKGVDLTAPYGDDLASVYGGGNTATNATYNIFDGGYVCYMLKTWVVPGAAPASWTSATTPQWTAQVASATYYTATAVQVGFLALSATFSNGTGTAGQIDSGDTIKVVYNETVDSAITTSLPTASSNLYVCHHRAGGSHRFYIGEAPTTISTTAPVCNTTTDASNANIVDTAIGEMDPVFGSYSCGNDQLWPISAVALSTTTITNDTVTLTLGAPYAPARCVGASFTGGYLLTPSAVAPSGTILVQSSTSAYPSPVNQVPPCNVNRTATEGQPAPSSQVNVCLGAGLLTATSF